MDAMPLGELVQEGSVVETWWGPARIAHQHVADLQVRGTRIIACDPLVPADRAPFSREVAPGDYPVILGIARSQQQASDRVAFAMLRFRQVDVVRWEMAHGTDDKVADLGEGETFGYGVDSGTGCFIDENTAGRFFEIMDGDECDAYGSRLLEMLDRNRTGAWTWGEAAVDGAQGNLIMFSTGSGDGIYGSWFGLDANGRIACLVTDFQLARDEKRLEQARGVGRSKKWWQLWRE
jgi:hypothetical protein